MAVDEQYAQTLRENRELQERAYFLLAACRDVQDRASCYGWALKAIADMDPTKQRADDLGRAARIAREALRGPDGVLVTKGDGNG